MRDAPQFPRFSQSEMADRHQRVASLMEDQELDALLFFGAGQFSTDVYWLTDWPGGRETYILFQAGAEPLVITQLYNHVPMGHVLSVIEDLRWAGANTAATMSGLLGERGLSGKKVGLVGSIPYRHYLRFTEDHPDTHFSDTSGAFRMMRTIKRPEEIARLRKASELTDKSIAAVAEGLTVGMREEEIPYLIEPVYLKEGGTAGIHFMTAMPMDDPHFPVPAQFHSNRVLQEGDCLITEISGAYWGYSGQIHRTFSFGQPTDAWKKLHDVAVEGYLAIEETLKDGATTADIEDAAEVIHQRGYSIYDDLLHGVSQTPPIIQTRTTKRHENPDITFRENMAITIQPNVITPDEKMGLQFGETVVVTKTGCERLNAYPREWVVCSG
ncbi:MAG: aminopeptidase P family protein [Rhodospirillaceae bacterium]|jgi:Xaa-Pro dipeptidase|nr:aminopeptidase P family protein [Rhodospirillaceae bacterium]MBT5457193.1 aminopeptidase P family protein [Rhodospirillaceae bacterium]